MGRCKSLSLLLLFAAAGCPAAPASTDGQTPRAAYEAFRHDARRGRFERAARLLDRSDAEGAQLARRLEAIFESAATLEVKSLSADPLGRLDDGLPANRDEVIRVAFGPGEPQPLQLERQPDGRWIFARSTVAGINALYAELPDRWLRDHLPELLLRTGPRGVLWWQVVALPVLALLCWLLGRLLGRPLRWSLRALARRTATDFDDALLERLHGPTALFASTVAARLLLPALMLGPSPHASLVTFTQALFLLAFFWAALRTIDLAADSARMSSFVKTHPETLGILPLAARIGKVAIIVIAVVTVLQKLGYPVASLIAGLGIGGLALALAAQKTVENLFGSVTLGIDQPFRPGDFVKIDDLLGTVESVGMRSTRIRTLGRTVVTLPNGKLADTRIETFALRDRMRFNVILNLTYSTTRAQLQRVLEELRALLDAHPKRFAEEPARVWFVALGASSLDVEIACIISTLDWQDFQGIREGLLLEIMEVVERCGSSFAFPTQTIHLAPAGPPKLP